MSNLTGHVLIESLRLFWDRGRAIERASYLVGAALLASGIVHLAILTLGGGSWEGPLSFRKPTVFGLSFGLTLITIAWTASFIPLRDRIRSILLGLFIAACILETALVSLQAWRGVPSHFNIETPFDSQVSRSLAGGGAALVAIILALTISAFRKNSSVPLSMRIAVRVGYVVLCAAMAIGGAMIARGMRLVFAGDPARAYATGGFLKPTHAVTMHAILVLPALAWLLSFVDWSEDQRARVVTAASVGYIGLVVVVVAMNIMRW